MSLRADLSVSRGTCAGFAVIGVCWGSFAALVPELKTGIGASDALFGTLLLASALGLVTAFALAPKADAVLGRWALPVSAICLAAMFPLMALAPSPLIFAVVMALLGVCSGVTDVVSNARVSDLEAREGRGLMNLNHAVFSFAYMAAAICAGLGREAALHPALILLIPLAVTSVLLGRMAIAPEAHEGTDAGGAAPRLPVVVVLLCGGVVLAAFMAEAAVESWSALHLERTLGGSAAQGALGPAMLGLTMGIGRLGGQMLSARLQDAAVARAGALLGVVGAGMVAIAPSPLVAYLGFATLGLGISVVGPMGIGMVGGRVPAALRTRAIARVAVIGFCGFFVAPPLMGLLAEWYGLRVAFAAVGGLLLAVPLVLIALGPRRLVSGV